MRRLLSLLLLATLVHGETVQIGAVYPILETDALQEIEARVKTTDWQAILNKPVEQWSVFNRRVVLPVTTQHRIRRHTPTYTTEWPVHDAHGKVLYPKGFNYNPLAYLKLWQRLVITDARHLPWLQDRLHTTDTLLLTEGDPLAWSEQLDRPVYLLDKAMKARLDVQVQPALVTQDGHDLMIEELVPEPEKKDPDK